MSRRSQTSRLRVNAFNLSFLRSSAILLTSLSFASEMPKEPPLLDVGFVVLLSAMLALCRANELLPLDFSYTAIFFSTTPTLVVAKLVLN